MHSKYPPRFVAFLDMLVRWCFYSLIIGWAIIVLACVFRFLGS